jgi:hypothetical protein
MLWEKMGIARHGKLWPGVLVHRLFVEILANGDFDLAVLVDRKALEDVVFDLAASRPVGAVSIAELWQIR